MASPYAQGSSGGGSAYAQTSGGGGSPYGGGGAASAKATPKKPGGFLGGIEAAAHWTAGKAELAGHDLKAVPGGLFAAGAAVTHDVLQGYEHPLTVQKHPHTLAVTEGMAKGSLHALEHPLADPFQTVLTVLPAAKVVGSAALRGGAAADAARAGEGAAGVVKAAAKKPAVKPRMIRQGDSQVSLLPSKNEGVRVIQHLYDKVIQHALDTNPDSRIGAHAASRVGGSILETERRHVAMQDTPVGDLAQAATKLGPRKLSPRRIVSQQVPRKVQEAALRLTSENNTAEEAAAAHRDWAAQGRAAQAKAATGEKLTRDEQGFANSVKQNVAQAALYDRVAKHGLVTRDEHGNAVINAADHPHLAAVDAQVAAGQAQVDEIAKAHDLMTEEQLAARRNGPARIRAGAMHISEQDANEAARQAQHAGAEAEAATTKETGAQIREAKRNARDLSAEADRAESQAFTAGTRRTAAEQDAIANAAAVDRAAERASRQRFKNAPAAVEGEQAAGLLQREQRLAQITYDRFQRGDVGPGVLDRSQRRLARINDRYERTAGAVANMRAATKAGVAAAAEQESRIADLRATEKDAAAAHEQAQAESLVARGRAVGAQRRIDTLKVLQAAKVAHIRATTERAAAEELARANKIIGGETARPGRGFVSYRTQEPRAPKGNVASAASPVVGKAKSFIPRKAFTGEGLQHGKVPDNTTRLVAQHMRDAYRYVNTDRFRRTVLQTGHDTRRTSRDVLVRDPAVETAGKIGPELDNLIGRKNSTLDELSPEMMDAVKTGFQAWHQQLVPGLRNNFADDRAAGIGTKAPDGYKWVDRNTLGDLGKPGPGPRGAFARQVDKVNTAVTAATVYFKLGHLGTRFLTNAATNIIQGSAKPADIARSLELWKTLTHQERMKALAAAGQHSFNALPMSDETGVISKGISTAGRVGAQWWAKHADAVFRFNSLAYEARKAGFDTPEKFRYLLAKLENPEGLDAAETARVDWVGKRANREAIAYDRLSHFERTYITRAFWFYPWTAAATRFFVNTPLEHPYKSFLIGAFGSQGRKTQQAELGDLPSYEQGLVKLAGGGNNPLVTDLSTFSPLATPADLLQVPSVGSASSYLNPAYAALAQLAFRQNQYGQHSNKPLGDALSSLFSPTPEAQILNAYLKPPKATSMFHRTPLNMLARAAAGPALPRKVNVTAAHSAAARERSGR